MLRNHFSILLVLLIILMAGCQGGGSPTLPAEKPEGNSALSPVDHGPNTWTPGHQILGMVDVQIDAANRTVEVLPMRTVIQHLDLRVLFPIFCHPVSDCLKFTILNIDEPTATITLDVRVAHPVSNPLAKAYDLRGVVLFQGLLDPGFTGGSIATQLVNADGYTTAFDKNGELDAFLNPYIAFNKDLERRVFDVATQTTETFIATFTALEPQYTKFAYIQDCSWADPTLFNPDNLLTHSNMAEPYQVNILYIDPMSDSFGSEGTAVVEVYDWQENAAGTEVECPDVFAGKMDMTEVYANSGRYLYYVNLFNDLTPSPGTYPVLMRAYDEFESQVPMFDPGIEIELANYQLGFHPEDAVNIYNHTVNTAPVASATADDLFIDTGVTVHFDASSSFDAEDITVKTYSWDLNGDWIFEEGNEALASYTYLTPGEFPVNVMVTDKEGLSDILDLPLIVTVAQGSNQPPIAYAEVSNLNPAVGEFVTLDASGSTDPEDGEPMSWDWDLNNDGVYEDTSGEIVNYKWTVSGIYYVDVLVTDSQGLTDTLDQKIPVDVGGTPNVPPVAIAEASSYLVEVGQKVMLNGSESYDPDGSIIAYGWDLNEDGNYSDAAGETAQVTFWATGIYLIDLMVTDNGELTDTLDEKIVIQVGGTNNPPTAIASASKYLVHTGEEIIFDGSESFDPDEPELSKFFWDLYGLGGYSDAFTEIVHWTYHSAGIYNVDLRVCDTPGACDTLDQKLVIQVYTGSNTPPVAVAVPDKTYGLVGDIFTFDGSGSYDLEDGSPVSWAWDLDDDGEYDDSPFIVASAQFNTEGEYSVDLKVLDTEGLWDTLDSPIVLTVVPEGTNLPPNAFAEVSCTIPLIGQAINFKSLSFDGDGTIVKWEWDFNEGAGWQNFTSTQGNVSHAFAAEGVYEVDHRVTDDEGAIDYIDNKIMIFVSKSAYNPPTEVPSCAGMGNHVYAGSIATSIVNTSINSRDVAFLPDGSYMMMIAGSIYRVVPPASIDEDPALTDADWVESIDISKNWNVALASRTTGLIRIYQAFSLGEFYLEHKADLEIGSAISGITYDELGNLWVIVGNELRKYATPSFQQVPCSTFDISQALLFGQIKDLEYSPWNKSFYIAVKSGMNASVIQVDYLGNVGKYAQTVLLGNTNTVDIVIDRNVANPDNTACRILVLGGSSRAYITRLDADLNIIARSQYGYWGIRAGALSPVTNELVVLEDCCLSWIDFLVPPGDWVDGGGD